jgi:hypothetical protein
MPTRRRLLVVVLTVASCLAGAADAPRLRAAAGLPSSLSDKEFWTLTEELSEPDGFFRSDNFLSNERTYQFVIPDLVSTVKMGGVYLGVGPEQNFPYIVALKSHMAFIIDIRRGNLHEQLLYKALFEMSANRAEFLSMLFSRPRPEGLSTRSTIGELFAAYVTVPASEELYAANFKRVTDWLTVKHQFALNTDDLAGLEYVYHDAFFLGGPNLNYSMGGGGLGAGNSPTYRDLMLSEDGSGHNLGYLANEGNFTFMKDLETKNLLVPVVGNFGGPKAIRAVGQYVRDHGGTVEAFYLSNVEQYLVQDGLWRAFCGSVATLPLDDTSTFIYSGRGGLIPAPGRNRGGFGGGFGAPGLQSATRPILREAHACAEITPTQR